MAVFICRVLNNQILVNLHNYPGQKILSKSFHISKKKKKIEQYIQELEEDPEIKH